MTNLILLTALTGVAGLGFGGVIGVWIGGTSKKFNAVLLSFTAGAMIALICFELLHEAVETGVGMAVVAFVTLAGAALVTGLDFLVDKHSGHSQDFITCEDCDEEFEHDTAHAHCMDENESGLPHYAEKEAHGMHLHVHDSAHTHAVISGSAEINAEEQESARCRIAAGQQIGSGYHADDENGHSHGNEEAPDHSHHHHCDSAHADKNGSSAQVFAHHHDHHAGGHSHMEGPEVAQHHHKRTSHLQLFIAGIMMAIAVAIHNVPEGMSVGAVYARSGGEVDEALLVLIASIIMHNIPEGMAIALPLFTSGMNRAKAAAIAALSGVPTILGALAGYALGDMGALGMAVSLSFAAGTLLYVVFGEVLPQSINLYCSRKTAYAAITGLVVGLAIIGMHVH